MPSEHEWSLITIRPEKRVAFERDIYFREGWSSLRPIARDAACAELLAPLAMLNLKPDAVVGRRGHAIIDYLQVHGFDILAATEIRLGRHQSAALWQYNWNFATIDRILLSTQMYAASGTLMLLLRDRYFDGRVPGSVRLSGLKGPVTGRERSPQHLREVLRSPHRLLNFVHVADEPADVVREVGILLSRQGLRTLFEAAVTAAPENVDEKSRRLIDELEARHPAHDLDFEASIQRLATALSLDLRSQEMLERAALGGRKLRWKQYTDIANPEDPRVACWDFFCVGCWVLADERPGFPDLLPSVEPAEWLRAGSHRNPSG